MCMVGYQDDPDVPGGGYFLVRNSWGTTWAGNNVIEPGHARIPYAYLKRYASAAYRASLVPSEKVTLIDWLRRLWKRLFG